MKSLNLRSLQLALLAAAVGLTACKKPMTYVHVKILPAPSGEPAAITDVQLDLALAGKKTSIHLTNGSAPIQFPTDVTLEVKTGAGQLAIIAIARNAAGAEVDRTTGTVQVNTGAIAEASLQLPGGKPDVQPIEASYQFGGVAVGTSSATINATFHNAGFRPTGTVSVALGGVGAAAWLISTDSCSGTTVPAGGDCTVSLQFNPVAVGAQAATLTFSANPGGSPIIALTGTGLLNPQNVAVTLSGNGSGTVASSPTGLSCSTGTCTQAFDYGTVVTLTPTPSTGSTFGGWTGACTGTGACAVTATQASTVVASFVLNTEALTLATNGGNGTGTVQCTANGVGPAACATSYNYGTSLVLTATATPPSSQFTSWAGCNSVSGAQCTVLMTTAKTLTVTFSLLTFTVSVTAAGNGLGNIGSAPAGINCGNGFNACSATFNYGTVVTLSAVPAANNVASGWSGACTQSAGNCKFTVTANVSATGYFNPTSSFCASGAPAQIFTAGVMHGCAGSATYTNRATKCAPGCRVASADEYVAFRNLVTPTHNYWTDDNLKFSSAPGACGPGGCGPNSCFATNGTTYSLACSSNPMHVCAATQPDPETNTCTWTGCGYNSTAPNTGFGGCSGANDAFAGSVCICGVQSWFVDQASGSDANEGTSAAPFPTIRHALGVAASGQVVHVKPGSYGPAETFPLAIPAGVSLVGDEAGRGTATTILGTVLPGAGATIAGFTIKSTGDGVDANVDKITIRNNTVTGGAFSIRGASTNLSVLLNLVTNNVNQMLFTSGSTASGKIENNTITHNAYGIEFDAAGPDLGGGGSSVGNNIFSCNSNADVWVFGGLAISAANNRWDHGPPTNNGSTYVNTGIDLFSSVPANVTSANSGASQAPNACGCTPTTSTSTQYFDGAMVGCGGPGTPASIVYASRSSLCPLGTHACSATEWNLHRGGTAPTTNYWTGDNPLFYVSGSTGNCSVSTTGTTNVCTIAGGGTSDGAMLVCPNGGLCQQTACGLNAVTPQFFGGCSTSSGGTNFGFAQGTLCCNP